jgi:hypothetical protein
MSQEEGSDRNYEVGRGKPPVSTRWKPGQSGNPNGRRKKQGAANVAAINDAFSERVTVTINGKAKTMTKKELVVEQMIAKILKGDLKALRRILKLRDYVETSGDIGPIIVRLTEKEAMAI